MSRFVVIAVAWLAACGDKQLDEVTSIKNEVCACKDVACGETAMKKMPQSELESSHRMQRVANEMLDCMARLYEQTKPTTDPDAETPEEPATGSGSAAPASAGKP